MVPVPESDGNTPSPRGGERRAALQHRRRRPLVRSARLWVPVGIGIVVLAAITVGVVLAVILPRAMQAKDELQAAIPLAHTVQSDIESMKTDDAVRAAQSMREHTSEARRL